MKNGTFEKLTELGIDYNNYQNIEEILSNHMIYDHDDMIIDIIQELNSGQ